MSNNTERKFLSVTISHPGTQHSIQTALALREANILTRFFSGGYLSSRSNLAPIIGRLLVKAQRRIREEIPPPLIESILFPEFLKLLASIFFTSNVISHLLHKLFSKRVIAQLSKQHPHAHIAYDDTALDIFKWCRANGVKTILDQSIGHLSLGAKILREEQKLHPEFADSISYIPDWRIRLSIEEAHLADKILVSSDYALNSLNEIGIAKSRITKIEYGADVSRFTPIAKPINRKFQFLFVGALSQRKGLKYLLEAYKLLNLPDTELVIIGKPVGSGKWMKNYQGLFKHVPQVSHKEIHSYFQAGDVFLCPSLHESGVIAIHEALACGLPVITTANAGSVIRDKIEGFLVPIRNIQQLAEKMEILYRNAGLREEMSQNAIKRAREFTWERYRSRVAEMVLKELSLNPN